MHEKHKADQHLQRRKRNKEENKQRRKLSTKEERTKELRERITKCESPSPRLVK